jgi:predicted permease
MIEILGLILPLFGLILLGFVAARVANQPIEALGWLNIFVIYVALPGLFFKLLSRTPVEKLASWNFIVTNVGVTFSIFAATFILAYVINRGRVAEATIQGLAGAYGNIGYMGPALAILALGEDAAVPVALIFCFENIMHFVMAPTLMALSGRQQVSFPRLVGSVVKRIVLHPFIIATAAGVGAAFLDFKPPVPVERLIDYLARAAAPCALFAMGVTLALRPLKRVPGALAYIVPAKLVVHPALMYVALSYAGAFDPVWLYTAVLLASLPTATNVFVIAQQYGVWIERATASVLVTTVLSVLTVSALLYAITTGLLPAGEWYVDADIMVYALWVLVGVLGLVGINKLFGFVPAKAEESYRYASTGGANALFNAIQHGKATTVDDLIRGGADVNARTMSGATPLMLAVYLGHTGIVQALVEAGADVFARDEHGNSPLNIAQRKGFAGIAGLVENEIANSGDRVS